MEDIRNYDFLGISDSKVYIPTADSIWKNSQRSQDGKLKTLGAGELKEGIHFEVKPSEDIGGFETCFRAFLRSIFNTSTDGTKIKPDECTLQVKLCRVSAEIFECVQTVKSVFGKLVCLVKKSSCDK